MVVMLLGCESMAGFVRSVGCREKDLCGLKLLVELIVPHERGPRFL